MTDVAALTDRLIAAWVAWDAAPGSATTARALVDAQMAFEPLGVAWLTLGAKVNEQRRGAPTFPGRPGHGQSVADAVQSAVNDLVPAAAAAARAALAHARTPPPTTTREAN